MNNLISLTANLRKNGQKLAYQFLDGMNWKQHTYLDIINSFEYSLNYLLNKNLTKKKVLNLASSSLDNTIITYCLLGANSSIIFSNYDPNSFKNNQEDYDIIILDRIEDSININNLSNIILIVMDIENDHNIESPNILSFKSLIKFGLLSRNKIDQAKLDHVLNNDFSSNLFFDRDENHNLETISKLEKIVSDISDREFSNIFYQKKDLFSLKICPLMIINKKKFANFLNWSELSNNLKETLPTNLFIDSNNIQRIIDQENYTEESVKILFGKNIKRFISTGVIDKNCMNKLESLGIELVNI